jgi:hypothetical protein
VKSFPVLIGCLVLLPPLAAISQSPLQPYGLEGRAVNDLCAYGGSLYAGTDSGVFVRRSGDTWNHVGLGKRSVTSVYPHDFGPIGYAVTAGIQVASGDTITPQVFCSRFSDTAWVPADSGFERSKHSNVRSIRGFRSMMICGETFACAGARVYMGLNGVWTMVFDQGIGVVNTVRTHEASASAWIGGETAIFAPFIGRSRDKGAIWQMTYPSLGGDNACDALALMPGDSTKAFAGMEGSVLRTTDAGKSWLPTALTATPYYFYGIDFEPTTHSLLAGGSTNANAFGLYQSFDEGQSWAPITPPRALKGLRCLTVGYDQDLNAPVAYIGTAGDGVFRMPLKITTVEAQAAPTPFMLEQNYPNPFNPATAIKYTVGGVMDHLPTGQAGGAGASEVRLAVFDVLGREVAVLVDGEKIAGRYEVRFDGSRLATGVYVYRLTWHSEMDRTEHTISRTMFVLR